MDRPPPQDVDFASADDLDDCEDSSDLPRDSSSSVHSHETNRQSTNNYPEYNDLDYYQRRRHGGSHQLRKLTYLALEQANKPDGFPRYSENILRRFRCCGQGCTIHFSPSEQKYFLKADCCRNRWCPACAHSLRSTVSKNLTKYIGDRRVRFLTLTLRHSDQPIEILLDRLKKCFFNLQRRDAWKSHVTGGFVSFECKFNPKNGYYHVHAHILYEGTFWDQRQISNEWFAVTGDSYIVHIEAISGDSAISYTAKYISKPANLADLPDDQRPIVISALHGRRLFHPFGSWKKDCKVREKTPLPEDLELVGTYLDAYHAAEWGDAAQLKLLRTIHRDPTFTVELLDHGEFL